MKQQHIPARDGSPRGFINGEKGTASILSLSFLLIFLTLGGVAIDFSKSVSERAQLQAAADTAAHAALYVRSDGSVEEARDAALRSIDAILANGYFNKITNKTDVEFGVWNNETYEFTKDENSRTAVQVLANLEESRGNGARNLLLGLIGYGRFDIRTSAVYTTYFPPCFTEGFVAEDVVDIQSNNEFRDGFCIHSNSHVSVNSNNIFEPGTVVSMPDTDDLDMPKSGYERNDGLEAALRSGSYRMRLLAKLPDIIDGLWTADPASFPRRKPGSFGDGTLLGGEYNSYVHNLPYASTLLPENFETGVVNALRCGGSGKVTLDKGTYWNIALITDCEVKFAKDAILEDTLIATTHTGANSFNSPSGFMLGRQDNCLDGGGSVLMTMGGFNVAAGLSIFGGQILALGDITFAADASGVLGASLIAKGRIDGTSNSVMGFCNGSGLENAYRADYFRMIR